MTILVVGASGATGRRLVEELLDRGETVRVIVRSPERWPGELGGHERLSVVHGSLLELGEGELVQLVEGCRAVASCLGHTMSWKGIYGPPYRLVTEATRRLCGAIRAHRPERPVRFVLMNTAGNRNRDLDEPVSLGHRWVVGLIRLLVPPHADNENAADFLRTEVGPRDPLIEWVAVRPDTLTDEPEVSRYEVHRSPTRSAIFDPGKTSRINVGHFMTTLIMEDPAWETWKGQMPVIYNAAAPSGGPDDASGRTPDRV